MTFFRSAPIGFALAAFVSAICSLQAQSAETETILLRWSPVRGSHGYIVEYRHRLTGVVEKKRIKANEVELQLKSGSYAIRVAGLNKFGKPGLWSEWRTIDIEIRAPETTETVEGEKKKPEAIIVQLEKAEVEAQPEKKEEKKEQKKEEVPTAFSFPNLNPLMPGLTQLRRGDRIRGGIFMGLFAGGLYTANRYNREADALAANKVYDPILLSGLLVNQPSEINPAGIALWLNRYAASRDYDEFINRRQTMIRALALVYVLHWVDLIFFSPAESVLFGMRVGPDEQSSGSGRPGGRADFRIVFRASPF